MRQGSRDFPLQGFFHTVSSMISSASLYKSNKQAFLDSIRPSEDYKSEPEKRRELLQKVGKSSKIEGTLKESFEMLWEASSFEDKVEILHTQFFNYPASMNTYRYNYFLEKLEEVRKEPMWQTKKYEHHFCQQALYCHLFPLFLFLIPKVTLQGHSALRNTGELLIQLNCDPRLVHADDMAIFYNLEDSIIKKDTRALEYKIKKLKEEKFYKLEVYLLCLLPQIQELKSESLSELLYFYLRDIIVVINELNEMYARPLQDLIFKNALSLIEKDMEIDISNFEHMIEYIELIKRLDVKGKEKEICFRIYV